ncbi:MAG: UDP binding domain-containing protein, partial [Rhodospirillales bacterium]
VIWCASPYEATEGADAVTILTEWNEFRGLDIGRLKATVKRPLIVDLRNIYSPSEMAAHGIDYVSVGRPHAKRQGT